MCLGREDRDGEYHILVLHADVAVLGLATRQFIWNLVMSRALAEGVVR